MKILFSLLNTSLIDKPLSNYHTIETLPRLNRQSNPKSNHQAQAAIIPSVRRITSTIMPLITCYASRRGPFKHKHPIYKCQKCSTFVRTNQPVLPPPFARKRNRTLEAQIKVIHWLKRAPYLLFRTRVLLQPVVTLVELVIVAINTPLSWDSKRIVNTLAAGEYRRRELGLGIGRQGCENTYHCTIRYWLSFRRSSGSAEEPE